MFGILTSLTKAVVAVALTPVAIAVDIVTLPFDADGGDAFSRTEAMLEAVGPVSKKAKTWYFENIFTASV